MSSFTYRAIAVAISLFLTVSAGAQQSPVPWAGYRIVDMSHSFDADTIYWPTEDGFDLQIGFEGITDGGYYYLSNRFAAADHGGTHLDAPRHFAEGRDTVEKVPLERLIGPACVIDVSQAAQGNADYRVRADDITAWEALHGRIRAGCIVLANTGYARFWPDRERYMGTAESGERGVANLHFPGFSLESAELLAERSVAAVGIDTPSIDYGQSKDFIVHQYLYDLNIPGFENVANLNALPPIGAFVIALPMKIAGGSGAPLRMIGFVPE